MCVRWAGYGGISQAFGDSYTPLSPYPGRKPFLFKYLRGGLRRKYLKTGMFSRKNVRTNGLIFEIPGFYRVLAVFFKRNLRWNGHDQWSVISGQW
jgi:hypothetical protein